MNARGEEALLALAHAVPAVVGTLWFQTLGVDGLPGGRAPWLLLLYAIPPAIVAAIAARRAAGVRVARGYGLTIAVLALLVAWHPPVAMDGRAWARVLAGVALVCGSSIAILARRVARRAAPLGATSAEVGAA